MQQLLQQPVIAFCRLAQWYTVQESDHDDIRMSLKGSQYSQSMTVNASMALLITQMELY